MKFSTIGNTITLRQGETFQLSIHVQDSGGSTINYSSGYTARMQVRADHTSSAIIDIDNTSGITLGSSNPNISIVIAESVTKNLTAPFTGFYELELITSGTVTKPLDGQFIIEPEVTK